MVFDFQFILTVFLLLVAGLAAGLTAGLFGIGGGVVLVPTLLSLLPKVGTDPLIVMQMAVGTSLALILPGGIMATRKQSQLGNLEWPLFWQWLPWLLVGVSGGVFLLNVISSAKLKLFFLGYLFLVTLYAFLQPKAPEGHPKKPSYLSQVVVGPIIGCLSVLLGIGGGSFTVPFFKFSHYPLKRAIALSTATGLFISLGGALGTLGASWDASGRPDYSVGLIYMPAFFLMTPMMIFFAPLGAKLAHRMSESWLNRLYIIFFALMTLYMFGKAFLS